MDRNMDITSLQDIKNKPPVTINSNIKGYSIILNCSPLILSKLVMLKSLRFFDLDISPTIFLGKNAVNNKIIALKK